MSKNPNQQTCKLKRRRLFSALQKLPTIVAILALAFQSIAYILITQSPVEAFSVVSISPNRGPVAGGNTVTITTSDLDLALSRVEFSFTGSVQTFTVPVTGTYRLETWGAQGGSGNQGSTITFGGLGGYSSGIVDLEAGTQLHIFVGGQGGSNIVTGAATRAPGGFNGGGASGFGMTSSTNRGGGGGGATDIRINGDSLNHRAVVAGGGSGAGGSAANIWSVGGVHGGGSTGATAPILPTNSLNPANEANRRTGGSGGTQTVGGAGGCFFTSNIPASCGTNGTFGVGGAGGVRDGSDGHAGNVFIGGGGGGGWFGGGGGGAGGPSGGGGSGWVFTPASFTTFQSGNPAQAAQFQLTSQHHLTSTQIIPGNASMPSPVGGANITGNVGHGHAAITLLSVPATDFSFTGNMQTYTAPFAGSFLLEVWGAQGGNFTGDSSWPAWPGGRGGYSVGTINLQQGEVLNIFVGGQGSSGNNNAISLAGGFNGGGNSSGSSNGRPGGGASDIRVNGNTLNHRVIVAGGGAGARNTGFGGFGGGTTGGVGQSNSGFASTPGTQISGGNAGEAGTAGTFGQGGNSTSANRAAGGGGWFGGGGGDWASGGSGWVFTPASFTTFQSGNPAQAAQFQLTSQHHLTDAQTIPGNASMPNPVAAGNITGNTGNGFARITPLSNISVQFGSNPANQCLNVQLVNPTTITCVVPPHAAGTVDVHVTAGLTTVTLPQSYTYVAPLVFTAVSPDAGPASGGTTITLTGTGLGNQDLAHLAVTLDPTGNIPAVCTNIQRVNDNSITCVTASHNGGTVAVSVTNGLETITLPSAFTYYALSLSVASSGAVDISIVPMGPVICLPGQLSGCARDTITVTTNHPRGYNVRISMQTADQHLRRAGNAPAVAIGPATSSAIGTNEWGISTTGLANSWLAVPAFGSPITIRTTSVATPTTGDPFDIFYGARVDSTLPAGTYVGHVIITATAND